MRRKLLGTAGIVLVLITALLLTGCPMSSNTQQQVAKASRDAMAVLSEAQDREIDLYNQSLIPLEDHRFILEQEKTLAQADKALNVCLRAAPDQNGWVVCLDKTLTTVNDLNAEGALFLKSDRAKTWYALTMISLRTSLQVIKDLVAGQKGAVQ